MCTMKITEDLHKYLNLRAMKTWSRIKVTAYRGEINPNSVNNGLAIYGQGIYSASKRSEAAKYGTPRKISYEELPVLPLMFKTINNYEIFMQSLARNAGMNINAILREIDSSRIILNLGYDGIVIGDSKDIFFVKYQ